ncbi:MAG: hypothetical protein ACIARQ_03545 [Phycisphaerales bacterium JB061]
MQTHQSTTLTAARWAAKLVAVFFLTVTGFVPKFTGMAGPLADKLPGGWPVVIAIGVMELVTVVAILVPRTAFFGSVLAVFTMLGAIASHIVGPVGIEGDFLGVFIAAIITLAAALTASLLEFNKAGGLSGVLPKRINHHTAPEA